MNEVYMFDYVTAARSAGISPQDLDRLRLAVRAEYPHDDMMFELRLLRTIKAISGGYVTVDQALSDSIGGDLPKPAHQV